MDHLIDPFSDYAMDEQEIGECVDTLVRLHGARAASYLLDQLKRAESETATRNWAEIADRYAIRFEEASRARGASFAEEASKH